VEKLARVGLVKGVPPSPLTITPQDGGQLCFAIEDLPELNWLVVKAPSLGHVTTHCTYVDRIALRRRIHVSRMHRIVVLFALFITCDCMEFGEVFADAGGSASPKLRIAPSITTSQSPVLAYLNVCLIRDYRRRYQQNL
jgi:hypothetical protein